MILITKENNCHFNPLLLDLEDQEWMDLDHNITQDVLSKHTGEEIRLIEITHWGTVIRCLDEQNNAMRLKVHFINPTPMTP